MHRVQRVPATETQGRIHTSTATVAVLPEAEEVEVADRRQGSQDRHRRSGGPGGQGVNTTNSAVQIRHMPTGMIVKCQDERSQLKNKAKALKVLRARLLDIEREKQDAAICAERRRMVGTGERSQKIRTYNYPQNRVTDHRIGLTLNKLDRIVEGDLDELISQLRTHRQAELLFAGGLGRRAADGVGRGGWMITGAGVDREALLCALVLAPSTFARNRFFALYTETVGASNAIARRAAPHNRASSRGRDVQGRGASTWLPAPKVVSFFVTAFADLELERTAMLEPLEIAVVRFALSRRPRAPSESRLHDGDEADR